jgi:hypothetical protein
MVVSYFTAFVPALKDFNFFPQALTALWLQSRKNICFYGHKVVAISDFTDINIGKNKR